jgi:hypothetical protein
MHYKYRRIGFLLMLALAGAGYFGVLSQISVYPSLRGYLTLVPVQLGALVYCFLIAPKKRLNTPDIPE